MNMMIAAAVQNVIPTCYPVWSSPTTISSNGTYQGNWESTSDTQDAVTCTASNVTFINSRFRSKRHCIQNWGPTTLTIKDSAFQCVDPGVNGKSKGRALSGSRPGAVTIERCNFTDCGIYFDGESMSPEGTSITVRYNKCWNLDGRISDGAGGYQAEPAKNTRQFFQVNHVLSIPAVEVAWNYIHNTPGESRVEDNINIYCSQGTSGSWMLIHDNYVFGGYPQDAYTQSFSGGGIITDGGETAYVTRYVNIYNNIVVGANNYGIGVSRGRDVNVYDNRVIGSGYYGGTKLYAANVGVYVGGTYTANSLSGDATVDAVDIYDNTVGWMAYGTPMTQNNSYIDGSYTGHSSTAQIRTITSVTSPSEADEAAELVTWNQRVAAAGLTHAIGARHKL